MYEIESHEISDSFLPCWEAAVSHLNRQVDGGIQSWLRVQPYPPFLEHLSFRLGNQLYFVRVDDVSGKVIGPGNPQGFITAANMANGRACILPMKKKFFGGAWVADRSGWGLVDPDTYGLVNPVALITDEKIEMSRWEVQNLAVQIVCEHLENQGFKLMSTQANPEVDPAIWFIGKSKKPEWVVVRSARFPQMSVYRPGNWNAIAAGCAKLSDIGHYASVAIASADQPFRERDEKALPLWRGHAAEVRFMGLE